MGLVSAAPNPRNVRLLLLSTGTGTPALPACGGASWCFVLWQQRWLVVAAGCCCELLRTHEHLLLTVLLGSWLFGLAE
jgi:hypothetical protein